MEKGKVGREESRMRKEGGQYEYIFHYPRNPNHPSVLTITIGVIKTISKSIICFDIMHSI